MAIVKMGNLVQAASGSLNGTVYAAGGGATIIRTKNSQVLPLGAPRNAVQSKTSSLAKRWSYILTDSQRAEWVQVARQFPVKNRIGDSKPLSGLMFFIQMNFPRLNCGFAPFDTWPGVMSVFIDIELVPRYLVMVVSGGVMTEFNARMGSFVPGQCGCYGFLTRPLLGKRKSRQRDFILANDRESGFFEGPVSWLPSLHRKFPDVVYKTGDRGAFKVSLWSETDCAHTPFGGADFVVPGNGINISRWD